MSLLGWFGFTGGLSDTLPSDELEILHQLGYTDNMIDNMGEVLVEDIIADYRRGILRKPGQTVDTNTGLTYSAAVTPEAAPEVIEAAGGTGGGTLYQLQEPELAAIDTFLQETFDDVAWAADQTVETVKGAVQIGVAPVKGILGIFEVLPLLVLAGGAIALFVMLRR